MRVTRVPSPPHCAKLRRRSLRSFVDRASHRARTRVRPGFSLRLNRDGVDEAFEVPLAFLMTPQNHKRESRDWNGLMLTIYAISFGNRNIWGATASIFRNLYERAYRR
jgi:hypothetical protein